MNASIDKIKYVHRGGRDLLTLGRALGLAFWTQHLTEWRITFTTMAWALCAHSDLK
jgi:hypothetical protein